MFKFAEMKRRSQSAFACLLACTSGHHSIHEKARYDRFAGNERGEAYVLQNAYKYENMYCATGIQPAELSWQRARTAADSKEDAPANRSGVVWIPVKRHRGEPGHTRDTYLEESYVWIPVPRRVIQTLVSFQKELPFQGHTHCCSSPFPHDEGER